ncbi:MAG: MBL fold metallo-hydrolase [Clostridia bacterium]|nr:MBL fold metallo-hydrolase [Clostridia bacterium]
MIKFEKITNNIMRLKVPFENIYTAVFLISTDDGYILVDAAACEKDVSEVILPALEELSVSLDEIKYLFCTHLHGDHGGGIRFILPKIKNAKVAAISARAAELYGEQNVQIVADGDNICGISVLHLAGHSHDAAALFDSRDKTLICGDAVQLYGITRYGCGVGLPEKYLESLKRLLATDIDMLVASHEYYPLGSTAKGNEVKSYINEAIYDFERICRYVNENREIGDAAEIAKAFTADARKTEPDMPLMQSSTFKALMK